MFSRRRFLAQSAMISLVPFTPAFLTRTLAQQAKVSDERILVVVQLDGGNDGLNTVIPYKDENYYRARRRHLRIPRGEIAKLTDEIGLHPSMKPLAKMFHDGRLTIAQGVGYPNPDRSHFRSMAIWHQARLDAEENAGYGWLGRAFDQNQSAENSTPDTVYVGNEAVPRALWGRRSQLLTLNRQNDFHFPEGWKPVNLQTKGVSTNEDLVSFIRRETDRSYQLAQKFNEQNQAKKLASTSSYPATEFGQQLSLISLMIKQELGAPVYYLSQPGYDTHIGQIGQHEQLLSTLASGIKAFFDDLTAAKVQDKVVLMAFSEFGRRVEENTGAGTDHGAAGPVLLAGPATIGGFIGKHPSLTDLDDGDLKMAIDFRAIYASLLQDWLRIPSSAIQLEQFSCPPILRS